MTIGGVMKEDDIVCKTKGAALAALETITGILSSETQKGTVLAVIKWIEENYPKDFDEETIKRIQSIYDDCMDEGNQKALLWDIHGEEPPHGTRIQVPFLFNADKKTWELEKEMPPVWKPKGGYLPQEDLIDDKEG